MGGKGGVAKALAKFVASGGLKPPSNERALKVENEEREAYFRLKREMDTKPNPAVDKFVDEVQRRVADAMGLAPARYPQITADSLRSAYDYLRIARRDIDPGNVSIVIPEKDFLALYATFSRKLDDNMSSMRIFGMEILRGTSGVTVWLPQNVVEPDRKAVCMEILRCLGRGGVAELPEGTGGDRVRSGPKPVSEVGIAPRPAGSDDRNPHSLAHLSDEAKVIAAKEAIAAYARKKQLPSAAHLALFGELDGKRAGNKGATYTMAGDGGIVIHDAPLGELISFEEINGGVLLHILNREADGLGCRSESITKVVARPQSIADLIRSNDWGDLNFTAHIKRNNHSLSAEPLGRAIDQIWFRENGGAYADLISSRSERLAEMVNRGDSAADGERG